MLETNKYVRCLLIDFSKVFDSVDPLIIINKLKAFNIADNIIRWVASFLTDRNQFVKIGEEWSFTRAINRSIVQGSEIGPTFALLICSRLVQLTIFVNMLMIRVYLYRKSVI